MITKTNTFMKNLLLFLIPSLIPILILGIFAIILTTHFIQNEIAKNDYNHLKQTKQSFEMILDELDSLYINFGTNAEIVDTLKRLFESDQPQMRFEDYRALTTIANFFNAPANARPYIYSIYVYFENPRGKLLTTTTGLTSLDQFYDTNWYQSYLTHQASTQNFWANTRKVRKYSFEKKATELWTTYRKIYSTTGYKKCIGVIVLNIYASYLKQSLSNTDLKAQQLFFIADSTNQIIFNNQNIARLNQNWVKQFLTNRNRSQVVKIDQISYAISQINSLKYGLKYISITPLKVLHKVPSELQILTALLLIISFGLGLWLTYYLTKRNYQHVNDIIAIIDSATHNRPLPQFSLAVKDEYSYITQNILKTFIEQNYLKTQLSERKYRLQFMELLALQSQINPHFLFNTLETIKWKMIQYTAGPNEATQMLEHLAAILHYSLESPGQQVTLAEEIKNTRNYLEIQKIRYRNKFDVIWQYDDDVRSLSILRLVLQPLLENCIYHGIKEKDGSSAIKIKLAKTGSFLKISVLDNGLGINVERLQQIRRNLNGEPTNYGSIGLSNTNKRLILTYGPQSRIHIWSRPHLGTVVSFVIPL
jgi:two-component system sensor histidine kinase YesM